MAYQTDQFPAGDPFQPDVRAAASAFRRAQHFAPSCVQSYASDARAADRKATEHPDIADGSSQGESMEEASVLPEEATA